MLPIDEAKAAGAMALFGEKYGDTVRMVDIGGPWSRELCGGTHVAHSSEIGLINVVGESSVGATNRRIESLVGPEAFRDFAAERALVAELGANLKVPREQLAGPRAGPGGEPEGGREADRGVRAPGARRAGARARGAGASRSAA